MRRTRRAPVFSSSPHAESSLAIAGAWLFCLLASDPAIDFRLAKPARMSKRRAWGRPQLATPYPQSASSLSAYTRWLGRLNGRRARAKVRAQSGYVLSKTAGANAFGSTLNRRRRREFRRLRGLHRRGKNGRFSCLLWQARRWFGPLIRGSAQAGPCGQTHVAAVRRGAVQGRGLPGPRLWRRAPWTERRRRTPWRR